MSMEKDLPSQKILDRQELNQLSIWAQIMISQIIPDYWFIPGGVTSRLSRIRSDLMQLLPSWTRPPNLLNWQLSMAFIVLMSILVLLHLVPDLCLLPVILIHFYLISIR